MTLPLPSVNEKGWTNKLNDAIEAKADLVDGKLDPAQVPDISTSYVRVGYTSHSIMEYASGATINDGVTSASAAITAALAAIPSGGRQRLWLPPGIYLDDSARTINKSVEIVGDGATILKGSSPVAGNWWTVNSDDFRLVGVKIDDSLGRCTGPLVVFVGGDRCGMRRCTLDAPGAIAAYGSSVTDLRLEKNSVLNCREGLRVDGASVRPRLIGNDVAGWKDRAVTFFGNASGATTDLEVSDNTVRDMAAGGTVRYPFSITRNASPDPHSNALFEGNTVRGVGKSYTAADPGNADCFGLFGVDVLKVIGNTALDGGDMGITLDGSCIDAVIEGNVCKRNDSGGIAVAGGSRDVTITGNTLKNNGQNRHGDRATSKVGIWLNVAQDVTVSGNTFADDQGSPTQQYGIYHAGVTGLTIGRNRYHGLSVGRVNSAGTSTSVDYDILLLATKSSDTVRNNAPTRTNDPHLSVTVEPNALYRLEMLLIYNATPTADISVGLSAPGGATAGWTMDTLVSSSTTTNGSINRASMGAASFNTLGGAGSPVVALPAGYIKTGANGGTVALQWAQGVAEVSDATIFANSFLRLTRIG